MRSLAMVDRTRRADLVGRLGRVTKIFPTFLEADGPNLPLGGLCGVETGSRDADGSARVGMAQVASVLPESIVLVPFDDRLATFSGAIVRAHHAGGEPVGDGFLGRVVDALGRPIDGGPSVRPTRLWGAVERTAPMQRSTPRTVVQTGLRAVDGLLTLGEGQRVGIFAASGVGKTRLVTQLANQVHADRCVIALIGERGREVENLWSEGLSSSAKAKTTIVAATSDESAAMRARACAYALSLASDWRAQGHHVFLLIDSVTRLAMALREIGLAAGEPPTVRAYTPGVFAAIPKLVESCGALKSGGAITAVMTVLSETDDVDDPISELMRSLLDGHIILSRDLAESGHFPAIDVPRSVSRLADALVDPPHRAAASKVVGLLSTYASNRTLIEAGVYVGGTSPQIDQAIQGRSAIMAYLKQRPDEAADLASSRQGLLDLTREIGA